MKKENKNLPKYLTQKEIENLTSYQELDKLAEKRGLLKYEEWADKILEDIFLNPEKVNSLNLVNFKVLADASSTEALLLLLQNYISYLMDFKKVKIDNDFIRDFLRTELYNMILITNEIRNLKEGE